MRGDTNKSRQVARSPEWQAWAIQLMDAALAAEDARIAAVRKHRVIGIGAFMVGHVSGAAASTALLMRLVG